jgi:hypothetical protein
MAAPYIAELQTAQWTSEAIREAFRSNGFEVREWPLTQYLEKNIPADRIFFSPKFSKLFGLQYKAIYANRHDFWPLDSDQHKVLQNYPWIFYCCSELKDVSDHGMALHYARFYRPRFKFRDELANSIPFRHKGSVLYSRWGSFYRGLRECRVGVKVKTSKDLRDLLAPVSGMARLREVQQMREFLLADFDKKVLFAERTF